MSEKKANSTKNNGNSSKNNEKLYDNVKWHAVQFKQTHTLSAFAFMHRVIYYTCLYMYIVQHSLSPTITWIENKPKSQSKMKLDIEFL